MSKVTDGFKRAVSALKEHFDKYSHDAKYRGCIPVIVAQWALESGWGNSKLAREHCNFAGLKWRRELNGLAEAADYTDWEQKEDAYAKAESPEAFPKVYLAFVLMRRVYRGIENYAGDPEGFIRHLAKSGFCASMPGIQRSDFDSDESYRDAVHSAYAQKVIQLAKSPEVQSLLN